LTRALIIGLLLGNYHSQKNTQSLIDASKVIGMKVITEKNNYMLVCCHQIAEQNHDIMIGNRWFENVAEFKYLGTTIRNET
jgi:hypothetical protein